MSCTHAPYFFFASVGAGRSMVPTCEGRSGNSTLEICDGDCGRSPAPVVWLPVGAMGVALDRFLALGYSDQVLEKTLSGNARRVLGI